MDRNCNISKMQNEFLKQTVHCNNVHNLCCIYSLRIMDMSIMLQHSWTPCLVDGRVSSVQSGSAGHHSQKCSLPAGECAGFQSNQTAPTNFTNQHAINQTEKNKSAGAEFGWNLNLHIFQGTGLDTTGLEETQQHTSMIRVLSMYNDALNVKSSTLKLLLSALHEHC